MLISNFPTFSYITWQGLIIVGNDSEKTPYVVNNANTNCKYVYWETSNPYNLKATNDKLTTNLERFLIYINDKGIGTEVPQESIQIQYREGSGAVVNKIIGQVSELDGKYYAIKQDVDSLQQIIGSSGEGEDGSLIERVNKIEQTAEGTLETIKQVQTTYDEDKESETLRDNISTSLIAMMTTLSNYQEQVSNAFEDFEISGDEKLLIAEIQAEFLTKVQTVYGYHAELVEKINTEADNGVAIENKLSTLELAKSNMQTVIDSLNQNVNLSISDSTIVPSEVTTVLNLFGNVGVKANDYKEALNSLIVLGVGGEVITNIFTANKTATEFSQKMSEMVETIDGETGLKYQVSKNSTAIEQTSKDIKLSYMKYDETTSQITVADNVIKLDAGTVLMTGTLTWDSLDDTAKENLKGKDGTNASSEYVMLTGGQIIKYDTNNNPDITSVTLTANVYNIDNPTYSWYYKTTNETYTVLNNANSTYTLAHNNTIWNNNKTITIRVVIGGTESGLTVSDEITIVKLYDGKDGENGEHAEYVKITGEQYFKYKKNSDTPSPTSITLTATQYNFTSSNSYWYYKNASGEWVELNLYKGQNTLVVNHNDDIFVNQYATIKYSVNTVYDIFTITKIVDGSDGYAIILSNENHTIPCETDGTYDSSVLKEAYTTIAVYKGLEEKSFTISKTDNGCTSTYDTANKKLSITKLTEKNATVTIKITVDGETFTKIMTITKALRGEQGLEGNGLQILGEFSSVDDLPETGNPGDAYLINGLVYIWSANTNSWGDGVPIRGEQGLPGKDGEDGQTTYIHIKYSNDGKTFTTNNGEDQGTWMGQYTDFSENDSTNFSDYKWFKVVGEDGEHGIIANLTNDSHIIPVNSDGSTSSTSFDGCSTTIQLTYKGNLLSTGVTYSYTKSSSITGTWSNGTYTVTGLSQDTGYVDMKATYEGVTYTKRFTVSKNVNGEDSYVVNLSNDSHVFSTDSSGAFTGTTSTTTIVTAFKGTTSVTPTIGTLPTVTGLTLSKSGTTITIKASSTSLATSGSFNIPITVDNVTFTKVFSWAKVQNGEDGEDGYTVLLTNENETFNANSSGNITSVITKTTQVLAFKGTTSVTPTIGTLPTVTGLTLSKSGTTITIKANTGTSLATTGSFNIPITVDGISFTKTFSWSKVLNGKDGDIASLPTWITEWDNGKTTINSSTVLSPKIFAGSVSNGVPTGVALGVNVFGTSGTYSNISGMAGYKNGTKTYHFSTDGSVLIGSTSGKYIQWDGSNLKINVSSLTINASDVATASSVDSLSSKVTAVEQKITADKIVSTVTSSTSWSTQTNNISTAQSTANTAKTNAATAQSTADTAKTNAATAQSTANAAQSSVTQLANKFAWVVKSGTSESNMTLTDKMYSLISSNITLTASKINLNGYVSANGNFSIDTSGNMTAKNGTFSGSITSSTITSGTITGGTITGAKIIGSGTGNRILINNGDYEVQTGSTTKGFFGLRTLDDGYEACRLALSTTGIRKSTDNYFVIQPYNGNGYNPQSYAKPYVDIAYRCHGYAGDDGVSDVSNMKMYGDGIIRLSPIQKLEVTTNYSKGSYNGSGEGIIAIFGSVNDEDYDYHLDVRALRNFQNSNGLPLITKRADGASSNVAKIKLQVYSDGFRAFRPIPSHTSVPHYLGSGSYRWQTVYAVNSLNTSSDRTLKENIQYLSATPNVRALSNSDLDIYDLYNFIRDDLYLASYNWIHDPEREEKLGFIAQDIVDTKVGEKILVCNRDRDDTLGYDSGNFEATIAGALKVNILNSEATQEEVNELKNKVSELEELVNELKNIIENQ